jgi:hypothetical protein
MGMSWLVLAFALEVGWMPMGDFIMREPTAWVTTAGSFYVDMDARATVAGFLFVGGEVKTLMWKTTTGYDFSPERMLYQFNAGLAWGPAELGWRHYCTHPITPYTSYPGPARWEGAYEELYLRLEYNGKGAK